MRKNIVWAIVCLMIVVNFVACSGGGGSSPDNNAGGSGGTGTVTGTVTLSSSVSQASTLKVPSTRNKAKVGNAISFATASGTIPVPGAICTVEGTDKSGTTDQNGLFSINGVSPGSHILICKKTVQNGNSYVFLKIVEIETGQIFDIGTQEITLAGKIQGKATLAGQTDSTGIKVYIPGTSLQATTDATGAYLISNVPEGTYELRFESTGYMTLTLTGIVVAAGQTNIVIAESLSISTGASGGILIANGSPYSTSRTVTISTSATSNTTLMQISESANFIGATWQPIAAATSYTFSSDGQKRLYIKFSDANGLESAPVSDDITIDTIAPTNESISINLGSPTTSLTAVTLTLSALDATTSVSQMMISNAADFSGATWETFNSTRSWTLASGDGTKTVYAKFKDTVGNETTTAVSATILLDTQGPTISGGSVQEGAYTNSRVIHLSLTASGATFMRISENPNFSDVASVAYAATAAFTLSSGDGSKTVYVRYLDDAGNKVDFTLNPITLDTTLPTTPVIFNQNQTTNLATFAMTLSATAGDANFKTYQLKGGQYAAWTDTAEIGPFSFTLSQQGENTLSIRGKDQAGNSGSAASLIVTLDTAAPVLSNISASAMGTSVTIQWSTSEPTSGMVEYGLNASYGSSQSDANATVSHAVIITGLSELTTYNYRIIAADSGNNATTSTNLTFRTGHEVSGNITSNATWNMAQSPYIVVGSIGIISGVTLTIEPGVTVEFAGPYTMLVKGSVIANGTSLNKIRFKSRVPGTSSGATVLKFVETNLSNSQLNYVSVEDAYEALRIGDESEFLQTNPKNSGTLTVSFMDVTRAGITTDGYQTTAKLVLTNATIVNSTVLGTYPRSEPIEIKFSTVTNSLVTSDSYNYGITLSNTTSSGSGFYIGCCGANINIRDSLLSTGAIGEGGGSPIAGPIQLTSSAFTNMSIALPNASVSIANSAFTYDSSYSSTNSRIKLGNGSFTNSRLTSNGEGVGLEITGYNGYNNSGQTFSISNSDITGNATGIRCAGNVTLPISTSNIYNNSAYNVDYRNTQNSAATGNYWGVLTASEVGTLIYDGNDDINYGILGVSSFSTVLIPGTGPQP